MNYLLSAPEEKLNKEAFGELPGPRGIIVSSLWDLLCTDRRQDGSGYERHYDKVLHSQMYQSSDPQEFYRGADRRENGCSRKVLLISFSNKNEIKRA